jgi:hypothetical protein
VDFRELTDESELREFIRRFRDSAGVDLPEDYLRACDVVGGVDSAGRLVCGYALAPGPQMRWPSLIPPGACLAHHVAPEHAVELNGVWLDERLRRQPEAARLWIRIGRDVGARKYPVVTFALDARKEGLLRLYRPVISGLIYEGPVVGGSVPEARVYWSARWRFRLLRLLYVRGLALRFLGRRRRLPSPEADGASISH